MTTLDEKQILEAGLMPQEVKSDEEIQIQVEKAEFLKLPDKEELEKRIAVIESALNFVEKVKQLTLQKLSEGDFVNYGGRPYLTADGAEKFRAPFGIGVRDLEGYVIREDGSQVNINDPTAFLGGIKAVRFEGVFYSRALGTEIEIQGGATVTEEFKSKEDLIFWVKKAQKNFYGYGTKYLLGLNSLSWDELEKVGIKKERVKQVEFVKKETITYQQANELWNQLVDKFEGDEYKAKEYLKNTFNVSTTQKLTPKQAEYLKSAISTTPKAPKEDDPWFNQFKLHAEKLPPDELKKILLAFGLNSLEEAKKLTTRERNSLLQTIVKYKPEGNK